MIQQEQSHQGGQAADHRKGQVAVSGADGAGGLFLNDQYPAGQTHDLKEHQGGVQIRGEEYTQGAAQGEQQKQVVPVVPGFSGQVLGGEQGGHHPEEPGQAAQHQAQAVQLEAEPQTQHAGQAQRAAHALAQRQAAHKDQRAAQLGQPVSGHTAAAAYRPADDARRKGEQHQKEAQDRKHIAHNSASSFLTQGPRPRGSEQNTANRRPGPEPAPARRAPAGWQPSASPDR